MPFKKLSRLIAARPSRTLKLRTKARKEIERGKEYGEKGKAVRKGHAKLARAYLRLSRTSPGLNLGE